MITYYTGKALIRNINRIESEHYIATPTCKLDARGNGYWVISASGSNNKVSANNGAKCDHRFVKLLLKNLEKMCV